MRLLLLVALAACRTPPDDTVDVHAAASLADVLPRVARAWTDAGGAPVTLSFGGSSRVARQIRAGAPADVFVSADVAWMDHLDAAGRVASRVDVAGNALVAIVPDDAAFVPAAPGDLADPRLARVALAGEVVPAGRYARAALDEVDLGDRVVTGADVRAVLQWVARGEADAGVVYATDAAVEPDVRVAFAFDPAAHPPIVYPAAALTGAHPDADAFVDFLAGEARPLLRDAGFADPP